MKSLDLARNFQILWGTDEIGIQDDASLFDAISSSDSLVRTGAWFTLLDEAGKPVGSKFQASKWVERMQDGEFRQRVYKIMDDEVVRKFANREGNASDFYEEKDET